MTRLPKTLAASALFASVVIATAATAQTTVYKGFDANTSQGAAALSNPNSDAANAQFQSTLSGTSTESFEEFAPGTTAPLTLSFTGSAGPLTATLTGDGDVASATRSAPTSSGQFATDGSNYYEVETGQFGITFNDPTAAFGFYATDIESDVQLTFDHVTGPAETFAFSALFPGDGYDTATTPSGSVNFLGFTDKLDPFTSVTFGQGPNSGGDILAFDQMTIGDAAQVIIPPVSSAPEPSTWLLMLAGVGAIGVTLRRRAAAIGGRSKPVFAV